MTIAEMQSDGYVLKSWFIGQIKDERKIVLNLFRISGKSKIYHYIASCPADRKKLRDAEFCLPIAVDNIKGGI